MKFVCDAPDGKTWFRIETEVEAEQESALMDHGVEKYFRRAMQEAISSYEPATTVFVEQNIGLEPHVQRVMPLFLTLRDAEGGGLATAMLPPDGKDAAGIKKIIVGPENGDPYPQHKGAIRVLGNHFGLTLDRADCFPYSR